MAATVDLTTGLILEDATIIINVGDRFKGAAPVFTGDGADITAKAKRIEIHEVTEKTNVSGASGVKKFRFHSDEATMTLEGVVDTTGSLVNELAQDALRRNIKVTYIPNSSLSNSFVKQGVITDYTHTGAQGEATVEKIEITLSADYPPAS